MGLPKRRIETGQYAGREVLVWAPAQTEAANTPTPVIWAALRDIEKTLPSADAMDRADPTGITDRGGLYRDEASVYRNELNTRAGRSTFDCMKRT
jgi:hypothetical protein